MASFLSNESQEEDVSQKRGGQLTHAFAATLHDVTSTSTYTPGADNGELQELALRLSLANLDETSPGFLQAKSEEGAAAAEEWFNQSIKSDASSSAALGTTGKSCSYNLLSDFFVPPIPSPKEGQKEVEVADFFHLNDDEIGEGANVADLWGSDVPKLNHSFGGISLWLEMEEEDSNFFATVKSLIDNISKSAGEPRFHPHATILYNIDPQFLKDGNPEYIRRKISDVISRLPSKYIMLNPKKVVFFPYPKEADGGKGFGAQMPFVLIKVSPALVHLFDICKRTFPPDERHSGLHNSKPMRRCSSEASVADLYAAIRASDEKDRVEDNPLNAVVPERNVLANGGGDSSSNEEKYSGVGHSLALRGRSPSFHTLEGGPAFTPHVSIAYLSILRTDLINPAICARLQKEVPGLMDSVRVKGISAWSTEGPVSEWKKICEVAL